MTLMGMFDAIFVNQLFGKSEQGETIFYPFGRMRSGYLVPSEREASLRSNIRWLQFGPLAFVLLAPRIIEAYLGYVLPLSWFVAGALVSLVVIVGAILYRLSRLTAGLTPAATRG